MCGPVTIKATSRSIRPDYPIFESFKFNSNLETQTTFAPLKRLLIPLVISGKIKSDYVNVQEQGWSNLIGGVL